MSKPSPSTFLFAILACCLLSLVGFESSVSAAPKNAPATPAESYFHRFSKIVDAQKKNLVRVTDAANGAADIYVNDGESIGAMGDPMFVWELCDRAGGLRQIEPLVSGVPPAWKGVVLYGLPDTDTAKAQADIAALHANGDKVVIFGTHGRLDELRRANVRADWEIDNQVGNPDGVAGKMPPTNGIANMAAGWEFTAEFVAALNRRGKMPSMWQSIFVPGATARDNGLAKVKFYDTRPDPIAEGKLGTDYIEQLRTHIDVLDHGELPNIAKLAADVTAAKAGNSTAYYFASGHADPHALDQAGVPAGVFVNGNVDAKNVHPKAGDVVFLLGYNARYASPEWQRIADEAHSAGATVVYSFADYDAAEVAALLKGDLYINQHWGLGDAEVQIKGYDIKVFPISGVLEDMIVYMTIADAVPAPAAKFDW